MTREQKERESIQHVYSLRLILNNKKRFKLLQLQTGYLP